MADDLWTYDSPLPDAGDWSAPETTPNDSSAQPKRKRSKVAQRPPTPVEVIQLDYDASDDDELVINLPGPSCKQQRTELPSSGLAGITSDRLGQQASVDLEPTTSSPERTHKLADSDQALLAMLKAPSLENPSVDEEPTGTIGAGRYYRSRLTNLRPRGRGTATAPSPAKQPAFAGIHALSGNGAHDGEAGSGASIGGPKIKIKVRWENGEVAMNIGKSEFFAKLFERFGQHVVEKGFAPAGTNFVFNFDGERVQEQQRPEDLDLEGDEILEVKFS